MTVSLGLDIGSNSVGSAWVDDEKCSTRFGLSVFPAGVEDSEKGRGAPKNVARRHARSLRRSLARRAVRKRELKAFLQKNDFLPCGQKDLHELTTPDPWALREAALERELTPYEFGRVLIHLNQRRGAVGIETDPDDKDEGKVKDAIDRLREEMNARGGAYIWRIHGEVAPGTDPRVAGQT